MSREFGSYRSGYFHDQIKTCAEDAVAGRCEITRRWGKLLDALYPIAYAISSAEEYDSGESLPIFESMARLKEIRAALDEIEKYLRPFEDVAFKSVQKSLEMKGMKAARCQNK